MHGHVIGLAALASTRSRRAKCLRVRAATARDANDNDNDNDNEREMTSDKIIDRVLKLLEKAESTTFDEEAKAFTEKAYELLAKHHIDEAMLDATRERSADAIVGETVTMRGAYRFEHADLFGSVGIALGFRAIANHNNVRGDRTSMCTWVGWRSEIDTGRMLHASLEVQLVAAALRWRKERKSRIPSESSCNRYQSQRSFMTGYISSVYDRLLAARRRAEQTADSESSEGTGSVALVLVDRRKQVDQFVDKWFNLWKGRASTRKHDAAAYHAGEAEGRSANIGQSSVSGNAGALN